MAAWILQLLFQDECICVGVCLHNTKTPDWNDLKFGALVVLDTMSKPVDFGFKRSRVSGTGSSSLHIFRLLPNPR